MILNSLARLALHPFLFTNLNECNCWAVSADCSQGPIFFNCDLINMNSLSQIGTDIEDYKCSWLIVQALERANEAQKKILFVSSFSLVCFQNKEDRV